MKRSTIIILLVAVLFVLSGCRTGGGDSGGGGAPSNPFIGGDNGLELDFLEGSPPDEVTDQGTFDFQATLKLKNKGEFDLKKEQVSVDLVGFLPEDFGTNQNELNDKSPEDDPTPRIRDSEGNIIEPTEVFLTFPDNNDFFNFERSVTGNTVFIFRADVCYKYQTKALSQICVLRNLIDEDRDTVCDASESKTVHSSGAPVRVTSFRQSIAGRDKISFSFDIRNGGPGKVFKEGDSTSPPGDCPRDPRKRREKEHVVKVEVDTGLPNLRCVGLEGGTVGFVKLVDGDRTVTCTQELDPNRNDFQTNVDITLDYNFLDHEEEEVLVKHLIGG